MKTLHLAACAALTVLGAHNAQASPPAPTIVDGFYQQSWGQTCPNANSCTISFTAVPTNKTLVVTNVSCNIVLDSTQNVSVINFALFEGFNQSYLTPVATGNSGTSTFVHSNNVTSQIFVKKKKPGVSLLLAGTATKIVLYCTIQGKLH